MPDRTFNEFTSAAIEKVDLNLLFPSAEELPSLDKKALAVLFWENHHKLLARVKSFGTNNIPYFGLHGLKKAEDFQPMTDNERPDFQVVTVLEKSQDPVVALNDLYDVVGGDRPYFIEPQSALVVVDLSKDEKTSARRWGQDGEPKNWRVATVGGGIPHLSDYFKKTLGIALSEDDQRFCEYFEMTGSKKVVPHAQKSDMFGEKSKSRVLGVIQTKETDLHLDNSIELLSSPDNFERGILAKMLYIQSMIERIMKFFKKQNE